MTTEQAIEQILEGIRIETKSLLAGYRTSDLRTVSDDIAEILTGDLAEDMNKFFEDANGSAIVGLRNTSVGVGARIVVLLLLAAERLRDAQGGRP